MTAQELKASIDRLDPKTNKALIEALTEEYNKLAGITDVAQAEPEPPKATAEAKAAVETASAIGIKTADTAPREVAQASTAQLKPYELSEPVKQIIKEFEADGDDGGYPPSAFYPVTEAVLKRYCNDNGIDYDELMKNNRIVKTQSFTQAN